MSVQPIETHGPRIYVACLAAYNSGRLHGAWIDADQSAEDIRAEINEMLAKSPVPDAEEFAIHDHDGFEGYRVSEYESIEDIAKIAEAINDNPIAAELIGDHCDVDDVSDFIANNYQGEYDDLGDWAYQFAGDTGDLESIPETYRNYVDWDAMGRDAQYGGDVFTIERGGKVHVFWNH